MSQVIDWQIPPLHKNHAIPSCLRSAGVKFVSWLDLAFFLATLIGY